MEKYMMLVHWTDLRCAGKPSLCLLALGFGETDGGGTLDFPGLLGEAGDLYADCDISGDGSDWTKSAVEPSDCSKLDPASEGINPPDVKLYTEPKMVSVSWSLPVSC